MSEMSKDSNIKLSDKLIKMKNVLKSKINESCLEEHKYNNMLKDTIELSVLLYKEMIELICEGNAIVKYTNISTYVKVFDVDNGYQYIFSNNARGTYLEVKKLISGGAMKLTGFLNLNNQTKKDFIRFIRLVKKEGIILNEEPEEKDVDYFKELKKHLKKEVRLRKIDYLLDKSN